MVVVDEAEIRQRIGVDSRIRRRRRTWASLALGAATAVALPIVLWAIGRAEPAALVVHHTLVAALWMVLLGHWLWRDRFSAPDAVEVEPVEVIAVRGREVAVETQTGRRLRWPVARCGLEPPKVGTHLWASAPVRRWHRSTLVAIDGASRDGLLVWRPTLEAVAEGPADVVTIDPQSTPVVQARHARIRAADPARLLADARRRAARRGRELLFWGLVLLAGLVSSVLVWALVPGSSVNFGAVVLPMMLAVYAGQGSIRATRDLARCERLEPVEFEARPSSDEVFARRADGVRYSWRTEVGSQWPAARHGPGWVTAPLEEGGA